MSKHTCPDDFFYAKKLHFSHKEPVSNMVCFVASISTPLTRSSRRCATISSPACPSWSRSQSAHWRRTTTLTIGKERYIDQMIMGKTTLTIGKTALTIGKTTLAIGKTTLAIGKTT